VSRRKKIFEKLRSSPFPADKNLKNKRKGEAMDIVVGKIAETGSSGQRGHPYASAGDVPVRVLKVRSARSRRQGRMVSDRREDKNAADPVRGKVVVLMVPDGGRLPLDLETGKYQLRLRIVPEGREGLREKQEETVTKNGFTLRA
jgi:hypothetical protein